MINEEYIDKRLLQTFALVSQLSAILVLFIGMLIFAGQTANISSIKFGTIGLGVCFVFSALSLYFLRKIPAKRVSLAAAFCLATMVLVLAMLNIGRFFFGLELANLLAGAKIGDLEAARFVTMAPSDAIGLSLTALALLLTPVVVFKTRPSELLTFAALIISVMTLLGVILKIDTFCVFLSCARISPVGGLTFAFLCLGILLSNPAHGLMALMASKHAGGIMMRKLIPAALAIPVLFSWTRMQLQQAGLPADICLALMISAMVLAFLLILWSSAWSLEQIDASRQQATARLQQSELRTKLIIQRAIDAFVAFDKDGIIKDWNDRSEFTFGWMRQELLGKSIFGSIVPERFNDQLLGAMAQAGQENSTISDKPLESIAVHKDGHEFPVEISAFPIMLEGELLICAFVRDISERKKVEQRFKEFYSTVSHELRSPLTAVKASLILITEVCSESLPRMATNALEIADRNLDRLIRLINDLLDIRRIEEGYLNLELQPLDPSNVISIALAGMQPLAASNKVELNAEITCTSILSADADRVVQVLTNLISNAIKFAPEGSSVTVRTVKSQNPNRLRFEVQDRGPGIQEADVQKLFSKFGQLSDGRKKLGTGLGLAISKAIVEEHDGEIGIESVVGKGSTFWFELPLSTKTDAVEEDQMTTIHFAAVKPEGNEAKLEKPSRETKEKEEAK